MEFKEFSMKRFLNRDQFAEVDYILQAQIKIAERELCFLSKVEFTKWIEFEARNLIIALKVNIAAIHWPQNWIEAFKERWFPKWMLKKFPVKYYHIKDIYGRR